MIAALPFATSWAEILGVILGLGGLAAIGRFLYRFIECQHPDCHELGLHPYKHLKLCGPHHPDVPEGGVTAEHIDNLTRGDPDG